ncbi:Zinc finger protein 347 [Eumeta japonica]|uniref:Zinc finger protein 347 n=1 Tax=Eumeta variegata TaxID=151549 RepID=A0A4C1Z8J4_EUMVA|nr:Zinc finger protein 347 [Eumeta japonica]
MRNINTPLSRGSFVVHWGIHDHLRPYACDRCNSACRTCRNSAFGTSSRSKRQALIQRGVKPYKRGKCGASFRHSCDVKRRKLIRTGGKPPQQVRSM